MTTAARATQRQPVDPALFYPIAALSRATGLGEAALRAARRNGLSVLYLHGRAFILGEHFIAYALKNATAEKGDRSI